jgi:SAM-dependent methyltransferase
VNDRVKLVASVLSVVILLFVLDTTYQGLNTLRRLEVVESERDRWQRPADIVGSLNLRQGSTVVDLGCGSGYFALKLSEVVSSDGTVYAIDIRRLPLMFLWLRSLIRHQGNVRTILGSIGNSRLPANAADAILIANTYHELADPDAMLDQTFGSLVPGGRLVIVDPIRTERGELPPSVVEQKLLGRGFDVVNRDDCFIDQSVRGRWWLIVARKP